MAIQIRRGTDSEWESNKSNIVAGEPAVATDTGRMFVGTGSGTYMELANIDVLADPFDSSTSYVVGDFVAYHGKVYKFNTDHSGAWNASHVDEVALADALDALGDDVYTKAETDALLALKADKSDTYTKAQVDASLALKADKSALNYFNETQQGLELNQTVAGTRYKIVNLNLSAGDYIFKCDGATSSDTDATKCLVTFAKSSPSLTTVASISISRGVAVSEKVTLPEATDKMYFFASDSSAHSQGDTFTYTNVIVSRVLSDSTLTKDGGFADAKVTGDALNEINVELNTTEEKISNLDTSLYVFGAEDLLVNNAFLKNSGVAQTNNSYKCSNFIPVKANQIVKYRLYSTTTTAVMCFYSSDSESNFVSYIAGTGSLSSGTFTVPSDGYIRFACKNTDIPSAFCYTEAQLSPNIVPIEKTLNVLLLGDSIFGNDGEIAGFLNSMCASCVNGAFGGTRATSRGSGDWQYFDGVNIVQALASQTWTDQDAAAANLYDSYNWITARLAGLKAVDMSEVDVICMDWGTNDYTAGCTISQITTAYNDIIDTLQTAFPEIRIIICTPIWRCWGGESDNVNGDNHTEFEGGPTLKEIANAIEQFAKDKRISVLNSYQNMPLSYKTRDTYFDAIGSGNTGTAYTHLNVFGNEVYAHLIRGKIVSIY